VFGGVGERLCDHVVGRDLDMVREAAVEVDVELDSKRRAAGQRLERWTRPPLASNAG
jgi:hypothetical protein